MRDKPDDLSGEIPWVRVEDFDGKELGGSKSGQGVSPETVRRMNLRVFPPGTVLCSCSCSMGVTAVVTRPLVSNQTFIGLVPKSGLVIPDFLYYALQAVREELDARATGAIQQYLSRDDFRQFRLALPPVAEQHSIADFLDAETARIDALIERKRRLLALAGEKVEAEVEVVLRDLADRHGEIPLKHLADEVTVGIVVTPAQWYAEDGVPALRGVNVTPGRLRLDDLVFLTNEGHTLHPKSRLNAGDLVTVRTGRAGATSVVPPEVAGANCVDLLITRPRGGVSPHYLEAVFNSDWCREHVAKHSVGAIQSHFNVEALRALPVPALPEPQQEMLAVRFRERREQVRRLQETLERQVDLLIERRRALITVAVTGDLDVGAGVAA